MGKIGRNEPCPCGSGIKYKKCCLRKQEDARLAAPQPAAVQISLQSEIEKFQQAAVDGHRKIGELGVFILFATEKGDAWLLEVSEMDAVQLAAAHEKRQVGLVENPETIEVDWSHTFAVEKDSLVVTAYKDKKVDTYNDYPVQEIKTLVEKIREKFSQEQLSQVHLASQPLHSGE
jgi:hypothetical protein